MTRLPDKLQYASESLTHRERVVQALTDTILSGSLKPGDRLNESRLARDLGLSRIPVREALQTLEEQGLVVTMPRRGKFVINLSEEQTQKINSLRLIFEAEALRLCRANLSSKGEKQLIELVKKVERVGAAISESEASKLDLEIHRTIWSLSGNEYLEKVLMMLTVPLFSYRVLLHPRAAVEGALLRHHKPLIDYVRGLSECSAEEVMLQHIRSGFRNPEKYSSFALENAGLDSRRMGKESLCESISPTS